MLDSHNNGFRPSGLIFCAFFTFAAMACAGTYSGGSGTAEDPYQISTVADWQELIAATSDYDKHFILLNDIDFEGVNLTPVAPDTSPIDGFQGTKFTGHFDGSSKILQNAIMKMGDQDYVGLFGNLGSPGIIQDLRADDFRIFADRYIGVICGENSGNLQSCISSGMVNGRQNSSAIGGLCGLNSGGSIIGCFASGTISSGVWADSIGGLCGKTIGGMIINSCAINDVNGGNCSFRIGGFCGYMDSGMMKGNQASGNVGGGVGLREIGGLCGRNQGGKIDQCNATGAVYGLENVGGLCGFSNGTILSCFASGNITGETSATRLGGFCGRIYGNVDACYANGEVNGDGTWLFGGFAGENYGTLVNCYSTGLVNGGTSGGGLCGTNCGSIIRCYAMGRVSGKSRLGGLCGENVYSGQPSSGMIIGSYALGMVNGSGTGNLGGLIGINDNGTIRGCRATGEVIGVDDSGNLGGLCGSNGGGTISASFASGSITSGDDSVDLGGLCGYNGSGRIELSFSIGTITAGDSTYRMGGLCGTSRYGKIRDCYSMGQVNGGKFSKYIGGLIGQPSECPVIHCYSTGKPTGYSSVGGLCGYRDISSEYSGNLWDTQSSEIAYSPVGMGKTTAEMMTLSTFTDAGWDFVGEAVNGTGDVWRMCGDGISYPRLSWEFSGGGDFACPDGVAIEDLMYLAGRWMAETPEGVGAADGNGDGRVGIEDFAVMAENWMR